LAAKLTASLTLGHTVLFRRRDGLIAAQRGRPAARIVVTVSCDHNDLEGLRQRCALVWRDKVQKYLFLFERGKTSQAQFPPHCSGDHAKLYRPLGHVQCNWAGEGVHRRELLARGVSLPGVGERSLALNWRQSSFRHTGM
jgi:hypothetical protein